MSSASSASSSLIERLPLTQEKVNFVIKELRAKLNRAPVENEIAAALNVSRIDLQPFINQSSSNSQTRYYGSPLQMFNKPKGSIFDDPLRYERGPPGNSGGRKNHKTISNKNKKKHKKLSRRRSNKKNRKSMKRK
jgi:hypothetical protein